MILGTFVCRILILFRWLLAATSYTCRYWLGAHMDSYIYLYLAAKLTFVMCWINHDIQATLVLIVPADEQASYWRLYHYIYRPDGGWSFPHSHVIFGWWRAHSSSQIPNTGMHPGIPLDRKRQPRYFCFAWAQQYRQSSFVAGVLVAMSESRTSLRNSSFNWLSLYAFVRISRHVECSFYQKTFRKQGHLRRKQPLRIVQEPRVPDFVKCRCILRKFKNRLSFP